MAIAPGSTPEIERRLQEAGTYHVIAISGGNIAILAGLMLGALALVGVRGRVAALAAIAALTAYAVIAAGGASVARATLMAVLYLAVRVIDQRTAAANAIGLSAGDPAPASNPLCGRRRGFWLTFGATERDPRWCLPCGRCRAGSMLRAAATVFLASTCAELALAPISALVFQRVTLAGLVLNFVALPAMTIVQLAAMAVVASDALGLTGLAGLGGPSSCTPAASALTGSARSPRSRARGSRGACPRRRVAGPDWLLRHVDHDGRWRLESLACRVGHARSAAVVAAVFFMWIVAAPQARVRA